MEAIDRSAIPAIHAAARRHRAVYVGCLFNKLVTRVAARLSIPTYRTAPCA
jgi:hypothetical protein